MLIDFLWCLVITLVAFTEMVESIMYGRKIKWLFITTFIFSALVSLAMLCKMLFT